MNSDGNHNQTRFNTITIADAGNYIGRFVEHYLRSAVADPEKLHSVVPGDARAEKTSFLVWASQLPTPSRATELEKLWGENFPKTVVMLSSCSVYGVDSGENINEMAPVDETSPIYQAEKEMTCICNRHGSALTILRLPLHVVGTDMHGRLMDIVRGIFRGTYCNIAETNAFISIAHASTVGQAILVSGGTPGVFNFNDATATTVTQLADALSYRIGHKRPFTIKPQLAKRIAKIADFLGIKAYGNEMLKFKTTTLTFSAEKFMSAFSYRPVSTTEYLTTHVYDENSL